MLVRMHLLPLLAEVDRFQAMRGGLQPKVSSDITSQLGLLAAVIIIVVSVAIMVWVWNKRRGRPWDHPHGLFRELSRVHGLTRGQEQLLRHIAAGLQLEHPSRLFLEVELFDKVFEDSRFAAWHSEEKREKLLMLRDRLYGTEIDLAEAVGAR